MRRMSKLEEPTIAKLFPSSYTNKPTIDDRRLTMRIAPTVSFELPLVTRHPSPVTHHSSPVIYQGGQLN
jgi:hypothetical protein